MQYTNTLSGKQDMCFIAHEAQEHFPYLINGENENLSINYSSFSKRNPREVKELKQQIKILLNI